MKHQLELLLIDIRGCAKLAEKWDIESNRDGRDSANRLAISFMATDFRKILAQVEGLARIAQ